ncbi:MAG: EAL domain-containing protein [Erysipelotrichaceae bacterium]|nr:EAL domain-containing protein [Erysipelotrichaceae bacterium]
MKKNNFVNLIFILFILAFIMTTSFIRCKSLIEKNLINNQVMQLTESTSSIARTFETLIEEKYRKIEDFAKEIAVFKNMGMSNEEIISLLDKYYSDDQYKRLGFIDKFGNVYSTDGSSGNLANRAYFQYSMKGFTNVQVLDNDLLTDSKKIVVFSTPIKLSDKETMGVACFTYPYELFVEMLQVKNNEDYLNASIIDDNGNVVAQYVKDEAYSFNNFYDIKEDFVDTDNFNNFIGKFESSSPFSTYSKKNERYYSVSPVDITTQYGRLHLITESSSDSVALSTLIISEDVNNMLLAFVVGSVLILTTITIYIRHKTRRHTKEIEDAAYTDILTGGLNYEGFKARMKNVDNTGYLVILNIREYTSFQSIVGHSKANHTLADIQKLLYNNINLQDNELSCHLMTDTFVLFLVERNEEAIINRVKAIAEQIKKYSIECALPRIKTYYGITKYVNEENIDFSYNRAKLALSKASRNKELIYHFFESSDEKDNIRLRYIIDNFEDALLDDEISLHYQPKYDNTNDEIVGAEALVRWKDKDGNNIPPVQFIPLLEANSLISTLDIYNFQKICEYQRKRLKENKKMIPISINLSRMSLYVDGIVDIYTKIVKANELDFKYIPLEITETALTDEETLKRVIKEFIDKGFILHMDDFGSDYSSLSNYAKYNFSTIKLSKSLIDSIGSDRGETILRHIIKMARDLNAHIVAEGVENKRQADFFIETKVHQIQGYYYSKPLTEKEFTKALDAK